VPERRGRLIAFEGTEGSGKTTLVRAVADALRREGFAVRETREPGGTRLGREIRRVVLHLDTDVPAPLTELLLYLADRAQHVATVIRPALAAGEIVLTDRFSASTIAYQAYGRGLDLGLVTELDALVRDGLTPGLSVLLDAPVEVGLRRAHGDDRFHRADLAFHQRVRHGFLAQADEHPERFLIVDTTQPPAVVREGVVDHVRTWLQRS
jgi:dTMP kinase